MSKLDEIIELIHGESCPYTKPCPMVNQGKRAILDYINEAIGKDEWNPLPKRKNYVGIRNELRKEQRARLYE